MGSTIMKLLGVPPEVSLTGFVVDHKRGGPVCPFRLYSSINRTNANFFSPVLLTRWGDCEEASCAIWSRCKTCSYQVPFGLAVGEQCLVLTWSVLSASTLPLPPQPVHPNLVPKLSIQWSALTSSNAEEKKAEGAAYTDRQTNRQADIVLCLPQHRNPGFPFIESPTMSSAKNHARL
eukprot:505784-Rhodomonas_salina.1